MRGRILLPSLIVVLLLIAACAPPPVLRDDAYLDDTSLLTGEPCEAPCWRGITPGETTWRDAVIMIEDDPQLTNVEEISDEESDARIVNFNDTDGPQCCRIYTEDGESVGAVLTLLAPQMRLEPVLEKYGEPTYVTGGDITEDQALLMLIYPDIPLVVYVFAPGVAEGELGPDNEIIGALYPSEADMQRILTTTQLYDWEGYTELAGYINEDYDVTPIPNETE